MPSGERGDERPGLAERASAYPVRDGRGRDVRRRLEETERTVLRTRLVRRRGRTATSA